MRTKQCLPSSGNDSRIQLHSQHLKLMSLMLNRTQLLTCMRWWQVVANASDTQRTDVWSVAWLNVAWLNHPKNLPKVKTLNGCNATCHFWYHILVVCLQKNNVLLPKKKAICYSTDEMMKRGWSYQQKRDGRTIGVHAPL